jgi:hypothetical protein
MRRETVGATALLDGVSMMTGTVGVARAMSSLCSCRIPSAQRFVALRVSVSAMCSRSSVSTIPGSVTVTRILSL